MRAVPHRAVIAFLRHRGWWLDRVRGSHEVWCGPDGGRLVLPRHREVSPGVVRQLLRVIPDAPDGWR
ncbi:type II toxin-antitoxin system HicA family toxin [Curtobacterium sp. MCBA15_008]|uniref:type II toxin-antitoxin system HicA family toxin n=1 Tax=Curtobacterium sp. MCBA15_008 TaxID=1898736 RepID=UPI00111448BB|nr:type II toxin-antitoxin system HicA family toxin [Curtobacterium sp. MCBA15_008]